VTRFSQSKNFLWMERLPTKLLPLFSEHQHHSSTTQTGTGRASVFGRTLEQLVSQHLSSCHSLQTKTTCSVVHFPSSSASFPAVPCGSAGRGRTRGCGRPQRNRREKKEKRERHSEWVSE
jgi:hypothetical protein